MLQEEEDRVQLRIAGAEAQLNELCKIV